MEVVKTLDRVIEGGLDTRFTLLPEFTAPNQPTATGRKSVQRVALYLTLASQWSPIRAKGETPSRFGNVHGGGDSTCSEEVAAAIASRGKHQEPCSECRLVAVAADRRWQDSVSNS